MPDTLDHWYALALEHSRTKSATKPDRRSPAITSQPGIANGAEHVTDDELERFERDGCLVVDRPVISETGIDEAASLIGRIFDRVDKVPRIYSKDMGYSLPASERRPTVMPNLIFAVDMERKLYRSEAFASCRRIAEQLLGGPVRYEFDQVILKPPYSPGVVPWHTDLGYKRHPESCPESVDFWISMQDTTVDMGSMRYIPGSQHEVIEHDRIGGPAGGVIEARGVDESRAIYAPLCKGGVSIHALRTLHGSGPNTTDRSRLAWIIHFSRDDRGPVRRIAEERFRLDSIVRATAARLLPIVGPMLHRIERRLLRRGITI